MRSPITRPNTGNLCAVLLLVALLLTAHGAIAQTTSGTIYGTIVDTSGAAVPQATVTVTNAQTNIVRTATTNQNGEYTFPVVNPGEYRVSSTMTGFQSQTQQGIRVDANQNVHVNFTLQVGSENTEITVQADTTLVDTRESQVGSTVDQKRIEDLPLNGRNAYDLLTILPGVTNYTPDVQTGSRQGTQIVVNGIPTQSTAYYLDGSYDTNVWRFGGNLLPNPDALQEFRVLTSNFDAEFGRSAGGVVSAITRSGTNQYHGLVYDYLRNNIFNAANRFLKTVTPLHQNQFGGNFGGPLPRLRDRAFLFLSYQGLRVRQPAPLSSAVLVTPTALERTGDFRQTPARLQPAVSCNGVQFVICPSLLDPVAQNLLKFVPVGSSDPTNWGHPDQQSASGNITSDQGMARFDYHLGQKHQISAMYFESKGTSNAPTVSGNQILSYAGMTNYEGQYNGVASDVWTISPNKLNDVRAYYSLNHYIIANTYGDQHLLPSLGSQAAQGGNYNAQPLFNVQGFWQMGTNNAGPNNLPSSTIGLSDTLHWSLGRHELKLGGAYMFDKFTSTGGGSSNGLFTFTGSTFGAGKPDAALVDFLEGHANTLVQNNGVFFRSHSMDPSVFVQDNWKLTSRLSLNLGLRWEYYPMYTGQNNTGTFVPGVQSTRFPNAPLGLLTAGDKGIPDGILHTPWNTLAPRFGFAYDVFGNGKTSLRGAYGIFYNAVPQVAVSNNLVQQPFSRSVTVNKTPNLVCPFGGTAPPCPSGTPAGTDPFPYTPSTTNAVFLSGANLFGLPPDEYHIPSVQMFSLGVQQQYSTRWSSEISYIGNVGRHLYITTDVNAPIYNAFCTSATCLGTPGINGRRPYQPTPSTYTFASISIAAPRENTSYHSLQATLQRRFDHHFSIQASYVWSKVISLNAVVNQTDVRSSRGVDPTDVPNNFVVSYIYVTPDVKQFGLIGKELLSGWQINGITHLQSGSPFNVTSGVDTNFDGTTNDRPNVVGIPYLPTNRTRAQKIAQYFNPAAFAVPAAGQPYGNAQFDMLFGPGYKNTDLSAFKTFGLYKEANLQFRAEVFNLLNNVNFNNPASNISAGATVGQITGANAARILQFALRLSF
jgi:hypothetical protein